MLLDEYLSMKEIAIICGLNQKRIGRALARLGLWRINDRPTQKAYAEGYIQYREYPHRPDIGDRSLPVWHKEKTLAVLKTIGIVPLPEFTAVFRARSRPAKPSYMDKHGD